MHYMGVYDLEGQDDKALTSLLTEVATLANVSVQSVFGSVSDRETLIETIKQFDFTFLRAVVEGYVAQMGMDQILTVLVNDHTIYIGVDIQSAFENNIGESASTLLIQQFGLPFGLKHKSFCTVSAQ